MNNTKDAHALQKGKLENLAEGLEGKNSGRSTTDPRSTVAQLDHQEVNAVQTLRSEHTDPGESKLSKEWQYECQVACIDKYCVLINPSQRTCIENRVVSSGI